MAIKTKDGMVRSEPICFRLDSSVLGITFELKSRTALFAPYSFLTHAQLIRDDEIVFHYSFGVVTVRGQRLGEIFALVQKHELSAVICDTSGATPADEPRVQEIIFEKSEDLEHPR